MVKGLDIFKRYFQDFKEQYVLIGGAACNIIFNDIDTDFRATKDLDIVLVVEALTPEFGKKFWDFIWDGDYERRAKSNGSPQFFRFERPKTPGFPFMLELFAKTDVPLDVEQPCVPLHLGDEISSLSAILLNADYYNMLLAGKTVVDDIVILSEVYQIPFKAKAWLDLTRRKAEGQHVDERDIRKHKNDVVRLTTILPQNARCELSEPVRNDMEQFIAQMETDPVDMRSLRIPGVPFEDILQTLRRIYL